MDKNLSNSEFNSLPKKARHIYLYNLLDYKNETMILFTQSGKASQDSIFINQIAHEFYDDGNPNHYANEGEERDLDIIEIIRNPISETNLQSKTSENSQYQTEITTYPSQLIMPHHSWISEFSQYQAGMKTTADRSTTPHQFQSFDGRQHLDGIVTSPQNPVLLQFTQEEDSKRQYNGLRGVNVSGDRSATRSQQEPLPFAQNGGSQEDCLSYLPHAKIVSIPSQTSDRNVIAKPQSTKLRLFNGFSTLQEALQSARERKNGYPEAESEDRDSYKNSSEEVEVPTVDLDISLEQEGRSDLNARNSELNADHFEDDSGKDQDFDYEIPRDDIGHLEPDFSAESSGGGNRASLNSELGISSDTNLETGEANAVHFANSVLSSILENLEEGAEVGSSTYNDIFNSCHISTIEDPLAMIGHNPATAGTLEIFQKEAGHATHGVFHGGMYDRGDYPANRKRKLTPGAETVDSSQRQHNQLPPTGGYGLAASDNLLPNNEAEGHSSVTHNKYSLPAGGYGTPASNNSPQNYGAERDVFGWLHKGYSLAGEYGLAVNDGRPPKYGATRAADTNFNSDILGQGYFSHEQYRASITMESYPVTLNREPNNEAHPSSFDNAQSGRPVAPVVQPRIQMPRPGPNPESDFLLPSIESDTVDGNNTAKQLNKLPENQANLRPLDGTYSARESPVHGGVPLNMGAPSSPFQYASSLGNEIEAEFKKAWRNEQIEEDPNSPILFFDSISVAQDTIANKYARECNAKLETEGKAAMEGQVIDNAALLLMPTAPCKRPFFFGCMRRPRTDDRPRRKSLTSIRSPRKFSPPKETGPEIPKYDFSSGEVPILPPDFNTAQEIKRRLFAKNDISSKLHNKRCGSCGYLGHVSSWAGCPALVCELCDQEGHGRGFCPKAVIADRWRDRHGKIAVERLRLLRMERMEKKKLARRLGGQEVGQRSQDIERGLKAFEAQNNRGYSQEALSPTSLLMKRQRLADENQARINEEEMRAPVSNMPTWPTVSAFGNAQTIAPMNQAQINAEERSAHFASMIAGPKASAFENTLSFAPMNHAQMNEEEMSANLASMITGPKTSAFEKTQSFAPTNDAQISEEEMSANHASMIAGPKVSVFENTQTFAPTNHAQKNEEETRAPIAQMAAWPMVNPSESDHNIASTTKDNWSHAKLITPERQPWVDMNIGMLRTPDAQIMATGPTVNLNSFENSANIASTANGNLPYTEWQPFENTRTNTHGQGTVVSADTMINQQGYSNGSEVGQEQYAEYRLGGPGGLFLFEPGAASAKPAECRKYTDDIETTETEIQKKNTKGDDTYATMDQQGYNVNKIGNDLLAPKAHAHTATEYNYLPAI